MAVPATKVVAAIRLPEKVFSMSMQEQSPERRRQHRKTKGDYIELSAGSSAQFLFAAMLESLL
jgi:hypothetical protein